MLPAERNYEVYYRELLAVYACLKIGSIFSKARDIQLLFSLIILTYNTLSLNDSSLEGKSAGHCTLMNLILF